LRFKLIVGVKQKAVSLSLSKAVFCFEPAFDKLLMTSILKVTKSIFYKIEFSHKGSKALRKMLRIFLLRAFAPLWLKVFRRS
jgi:hypothetical protein